METNEQLTLYLNEDLPLPPWGIQYNFVNDELGRVKRPGAWLSGREMSKAERIADYERWRNARLKEINEHLWPTYDPVEHRWTGPSVRWMRELTAVDLRLMVQIQHSGHFQAYPDLDVQPSDPKTHVELFVMEDENGAANIWNGFGSYYPAEDSLVSQISDICGTADESKEIPVNYWFKEKLQRPRPWQMALRFLKAPFVYYGATSAITPSMCSGHCFQSLVAVGAAIERFLDDDSGDPEEANRKLPKMVAALARWAVDIGDRRVMAGVHYPSDNICSWFLFLTIAEFIFHRPEVRHHIARAITRSFVFQEIQKHINNGGEVYGRPLSLIEGRLPLRVDCCGE